MSREIDLTVNIALDRPDKVIKVHPNLPEFPSYTLVIGCGNSGKTLLLVSVLEQLKSVFKNKLLVFTSSYSNTMADSVKRLHGKMYDTLLNDSGQDRIALLLEHQKKLKEAGKKLLPVLIILDDFITDPSFNKRRGTLTKLFTQGRHYNVSIVITSQSFKLLPSAIRKLAHYFILFSTANSKEKKSICEELNTFLPEREFTELFEKATSKRFDFLFIDGKKDRYLQNFDAVLASKY
jgi:hypothetical protein